MKIAEMLRNNVINYFLYSSSFLWSKHKKTPYIKQRDSRHSSKFDRRFAGLKRFLIMKKKIILPIRNGFFSRQHGTIIRTADSHIFTLSRPFFWVGIGQFFSISQSVCVVLCTLVEFIVQFDCGWFVNVTVLLVNKQRILSKRIQIYEMNEMEAGMR